MLAQARPSLRNGIADEMPIKQKSMRPVITSASAAGPPVSGTCVALTPADSRKRDCQGDRLEHQAREGGRAEVQLTSRHRRAFDYERAMSPFGTCPFRKFHPPYSHRDYIQLCPKPVGRAAGLARIHRTAIMPVIIAITKTKTSIRPLASDTRAGPGQYPASPQPTPKTTAPEIRGASIAVEVGRLKRGDQSGRPRPNTRR